MILPPISPFDIPLYLERDHYYDNRIVVMNDWRSGVGHCVLASVRGLGGLIAHNIASAYRPEGLR